MNRLLNDEIHTITIDLPMKNPLDDLESMAKYNLLFKLLKRVGHGGGNPYIQLTGKVSDLRAWVTEQYFGGEGDLEDIEYRLWGEPTRCVCHGELVDVATDFRDNTSRREFEISRLCQKSQDEIFEEADSE